MLIQLVRLILISLVLSGCTTIKITDQYGSVLINREFGFVNLNANPKKGTVIVDLSSLGYVTTPIGHAFGFSRQSVTITSGDCKLILWVDNFDNVLALKKLLGDVNTICFAYSDTQ